MNDEARKRRGREASKRYRDANYEKVHAYNERWKKDNYEHYRKQQREYLRMWRARQREKAQRG